MVKRVAPGFLLFVLSPLIAEYLSGSMATDQLGLLPMMMLLYGGGAVLIRETTRRARRGWPTILLLGLAYGLVEEGLVDFSLFNPNFRGLHLLAFGDVPALGIGVPWTIYVLAIHVVWSIAVPIALVEALVPGRRAEPWLHIPGLAITALLYGAGVALIIYGVYLQEHFIPAPPQLAGAALAVVACIVLAFAVPRERPKAEGRAPNSWSIALVAFAAGSALVMVYGQGGPLGWPWEAVAGAMLALGVGVLAFGLVLGRTSGWTDVHRFAMAAGALLAYVWSGFLTERALYPASNPLHHAALAFAMIIVLAIIAARLRKRAA
jgi:hypothetical protein